MPARVAVDFSPEVTAQPKTLPDEIASAIDDHEDPGLSVDPEDLGAHFLSEATQQGDSDAERATVRELSLFDFSEGEDEAADAPEAVSIWEELASSTIRDAEARPETFRSHERHSGFAPAGTHAASQRDGRIQAVLRFTARALRWLADRLQPTAADRR